jgi:hypothetical protein
MAVSIMRERERERESKNRAKRPYIGMDLGKNFAYFRFP